MHWDGPRLLSRPLGVYWAGWETTTLALQRNGWDLAVEHDHYRNGYTLLMRHEAMQLHACTSELTLERLPQERWEHVPVFQVRAIARTLQTAHMPRVDFAAFQQIDAEPRFVDHKIQRVEDFNIFALARSKAEEVLVNKADMTVIEHLEAIKRLQEPKQRELRQEMLRGRESARPSRSTPKLQLVAQLIHLEEAA